MRFLTILFLNLYSITLFSASLDDTLSEIRMMATARVQFNQSWVTYLTEGNFGEAEDEPATPEERVEYYKKIFCTKTIKKGSAVDKLSRSVDAVRLNEDNKKLFVDDIGLYTRIVKMIDDNRESEHFADCLLSYLHALFCVAPKEKINDRELAESFWLSSMRNKLNPYVSSHTHYLKNFLKSVDRNWVFDALLFANEVPVLERRIYQTREIIIPKITATINNHTDKCIEGLSKILVDPILQIESGEGGGSPHRLFCENIWNPFASKYIVKKIENSYFLPWILGQDPLAFQNWFVRNLLPILAEAEKTDLEGKRWKTFIDEAEVINRKFGNNCCTAWKEHQESLKKPQPKGKKALAKATKAQQAESAKAVMVQPDKKEQDDDSQECAVTAETAQSFPPQALHETMAAQSSAAIAATAACAETIEGGGAAAAAAACGAEPAARFSSVDTKDSFVFEPVTLSSDDEEDDDNATSTTDTGAGGAGAAATEPVADRRVPAVFRTYKSVQMIFETRGPVNYDTFERQLTRDFRDHLFQPKEQRSGVLRELRLNVSANKIARACALYHSPHGAQDLKAWPQWRIAYKRMFETLAAAFPVPVAK